MINNQLTREENVQAVFDLKAGYTLGLADVEILKRVARMALAAMDSEPFAYIIQDKYERERGVEGHLSRSHVSKYVSQEDINEHEITCTPLYRHAQQPVVPDALADAFIAAIEKEQDRLHEEDYLMDSKDCIDVIREEVQRLNANCITTLTVSPQEVK
ncbi:hypothetical protein ACTMSH_30285 [Klebsiella grimontii]|uniref:hypothetical protein n=1 Tax=Klebsiella grimontii TaxID=2058152 RepID=UPI003F8C161A